MANETVRLNVMDNMANQDQLNVDPKDNNKIYTIWDLPIDSRQERNPLFKRFVRFVWEKFK